MTGTAPMPTFPELRPMHCGCNAADLLRPYFYEDLPSSEGGSFLHVTLFSWVCSFLHVTLFFVGLFFCMWFFFRTGSFLHVFLLGIECFFSFGCFVQSKETIFSNSGSCTPESLYFIMETVNYKNVSCCFYEWRGKNAGSKQA